MMWRVKSLALMRNIVAMDSGRSSFMEGDRWPHVPDKPIAPA